MKKSEEGQIRYEKVSEGHKRKDLRYDKERNMLLYMVLLLVSYNDIYCLYNGVKTLALRRNL